VQNRFRSVKMMDEEIKKLLEMHRELCKRKLKRAFNLNDSYGIPYEQGKLDILDIIDTSLRYKAKGGKNE